MGNSASAAARGTLAVSTLAELGENEVQYEKSMGSSRFLKAVRARHTEGLIVVKTFVKPDGSLPLRHLFRRLKKERETLANVPNVLTYQQTRETDRAGYLIRQWVSSNLYDRISTRPFLTNIEKRWITYQMLFAMRASREKDIPHGDLKTENVLVTSSMSVYVTDFAASFKPTYLPLDDPADFSFFFDASGRRTCYVAPERFYSAGSEIAKQKASMRSGAASSSSTSGPSGAGNTSITSSGDPYSEILGLGKRDGKVTEAMDVFSLGCVITELWRDGSPLFTLSQLFKYREGRFDLDPPLNEIQDPALRTMIRSMLALDPNERPTFSRCLDTHTGLFPSSFETFLHPYLVDLQRYHPITCAAARQQQRYADHTDLPLGGLSQPSNSEQDVLHLTMEDPAMDTQRQADLRLEQLYEEWAQVVRHVDRCEAKGYDTHTDEWEEGEPIICGSSYDAEQMLPMQLNIPRIDSSALRSSSRLVTEDGTGLMVLSVILGNLRSALRATTKVHALELLLHLSAVYLTDEAKLDRVLPYLIALYDDPNVSVRAAAVRSTVQLLLLVRTITPANESVCLEYVFPNLRRIAGDLSATVRGFYAACFPTLISCAQRFLQQTQALRASGAFVANQDGYEDFDHLSEEASFDVQLDDIRAFAQEQITSLLTDLDSSVKRSLLCGIGQMCTFLGKAMTNDVLLSHMITYLNDRDWQLRDAFFESIPDLAIVAGARSVEEFIVPLMMQGLSDAEDSVVVRVLTGLTRIVTDFPSPLLSEFQIYDLVAATCGFLCHSNPWMRQAAARFLAAATVRLDTTDIWAVIYPSIRPLLRYELTIMSCPSLLDSVKSPLSRNILQAALTWAATATKTAFWRGDEVDELNSTAGVGNPLALGGLRHLTRLPDSRPVSDSKLSLPRSDEDDGFMDKLRALGFTSDDEVKLLGLREYIWKVSKHLGRQRLLSTDESSGPSTRQHSELQDIPDVTPQTIFFTFNKASTSMMTEAAVGDSMRLGSMRSPSARSIFPGHLSGRRMVYDRSFSSSSAAFAFQGSKRQVSSSSSVADRVASVRRPSRSTSNSGPDTTQFSLASQRSASGQARLGTMKTGPAVVAETSANATGTMSDMAAKLRTLSMASAVAVDSPTPAGSTTSTIRGAMTPVGVGGGGVDEFDGSIFRSTYEGRDPYILTHLEIVFLKNFRDRSSEQGARVNANPGLRRRTGKPSLASAGVNVATRDLAIPSTSPSPTSGSRRPEGKLVAYFNEHVGPITAIAVSPDHAFFASGSEDGTVKIWDTARLEKNVTSRSRTIYSGHSGQISALIALQSTHCFASAATDGSLHVWRVDISAATLPKYGKPRLVSNFQLSTPGEYIISLLQSSSDSPSAKLILGTSHSRITILDLRTMQVLQALKNPAHFGPITCMCRDKQDVWLLVGTLGGAVALWDLRFGLLVKSWRVGSGEGVPSTCLVRVTACSLHPSKGRGRWVMISYEQTFPPSESTSQSLIETWDIDRGALVESYEVSTSRGAAKSSRAGLRGTLVARSDNLSSAKSAIEQLVRTSEAHHEGSIDGSDRNRSIPSGTAAMGTSVKCFVASTEGYASGSLSGGSQVSGGWLDAGKLAREANRDGDANAARSDGRGPAGFIVSAGEDCNIRFWDLGKPERSVCFGLAEGGKGEFKAVSSEGAEPQRLVHQHSTSITPSILATGKDATRSPLISLHQNQQAQTYMRAHRDTITAVAIIESPFRCIVTGDRTGSIKVWE